MAIERTLGIIKPDAVKRNLVGSILARIEAARFKIIALDMLTLSQDKAARFYVEHKNQSFYEDLINYMTSDKVVVFAIEAEDGIKRYRELIGATDPKTAATGTIRYDFALSKSENSVHGSDSQASAKRELEFFFGEDILFF